MTCLRCVNARVRHELYLSTATTTLWELVSPMDSWMLAICFRSTVPPTKNKAKGWTGVVYIKGIKHLVACCYRRIINTGVGDVTQCKKKLLELHLTSAKINNKCSTTGDDCCFYDSYVHILVDWPMPRYSSEFCSLVLVMKPSLPRTVPDM